MEQEGVDGRAGGEQRRSQGGGRAVRARQADVQPLIAPQRQPLLLLKQVNRGCVLEGPQRYRNRGSGIGGGAVDDHRPRHHVDGAGDLGRCQTTAIADVVGDGVGAQNGGVHRVVGDNGAGEIALFKVAGGRSVIDVRGSLGDVDRGVAGQGDDRGVVHRGDGEVDDVGDDAAPPVVDLNREGVGAVVVGGRGVGRHPREAVDRQCPVGGGNRLTVGQAVTVQVGGAQRQGQRGVLGCGCGVGVGCWEGEGRNPVDRDRLAGSREQSRPLLHRDDGAAVGHAGHRSVGIDRHYGRVVGAPGHPGRGNRVFIYRGEFSGQGIAHPQVDEGGCSPKA